MRASKRWALVTALVCVMAASAAAGVPNVTVPEWAREVASRPRKSYDPRTSAVVLLDERTVTVTKPDEYVENVRRVVRILRPEGKVEARLHFYVGTGESLLKAHAWGMSPDDHNYELKQGEFVQMQEYGGMALYSDVVYYRAEVPGSNPGAVVAYEYTIRAKAWWGAYHWFAQEALPVEEARLRLELPEGWKQQASWVNVNPVTAVASGAGAWSWTLRDVAAIDVEEKHRPAEVALAGRAQIAFAPPGNGKPMAAEWATLGDWTHGLVEPRKKVTPEIETKVRELTAGVTDFDGKVARLAEFMQREIRYVAVSIGLGGWQPHAAGDVFRYRYGDCKDKATLLAAMLEVVGIRSENVPIFDEHGVTHADSVERFFDHQILAIELPESSKAKYNSVVVSKTGKRYLIFDPTNEWVPVGELPYYEQGNYALLAGNPGELIHLPVEEPGLNREVRTGRFSLDEGGMLNGELEVSGSGTHGWLARARMKSSTELERTQHAELFVTRAVHGATLKKVQFGNEDKIGEELKTRYTITAQGMMQHAGRLLLVKPCLFGRQALGIEWAKRKYPVDLLTTTEELDRFEITLPPGVVVDELPDPVKVDVGFASYTSTVTSTEGVLRFESAYVVRDPLVPVEKLGLLKKLEEAMSASQSASVVLKKKV